MTHPDILHAERTGLAPGQKDNRNADELPHPRRTKLDKDNRFYSLNKKVERLNNGN